MHTICFLPFDTTGDFPSGTTLLDAASSLEITLRADCGGNGTCGKCRVHLVFENEMETVLACRYEITKSLTVSIPPESLVNDTVSIVVDSDTNLAQHDSNPVLSLIPVTLSEPTREDCRPDLQRLSDFFETPSNLSLNFIRKTPGILRQCSWKGNAVFLEDSLVDFVAENDEAGFYAVALDIGTTTLAAELVPFDMMSNDILHEKRIHTVQLNPQKRFGDDIITRIGKIIETPENLDEQHRILLDAVKDMICDLARQSNIDPQRIIFVTVSGNTAMQQLFHRIDPGPLGVSPFVPATRHYPVVSAREYDLPIHSDAQVRTLPVLGGFVGGDLVAGILATNMDRFSVDAPATLLIDVGTNGEMILAHKGRLWAASTAAGPAFEGAGIEHGMIASPGAVDRVDLSGPISIRTLGHLPPIGICGSGLIDLTAELLRHGVIASNGRFSKDISSLRDDIRAKIEEQSFRLSASDTKHPQVRFTQRDVRQVQLAAGAIRCGVMLLLEKANLKPSDIEQVFLAGGFGSFINRDNAKRIGLFPPDIDTDKIRFCGNTSLLGAKMLARDRDTANRAKHVADRAEHVDLSTCENFSTVFAQCMVFP